MKENSISRLVHVLETPHVQYPTAKLDSEVAELAQYVVLHLQQNGFSRGIRYNSDTTILQNTPQVFEMETTDRFAGRDGVHITLVQRTLHADGPAKGRLTLRLEGLPEAITAREASIREALTTRDLEL